MAGFKSQVQPVANKCRYSQSPRNPLVGWSRIPKDVTCTFTIFPTDNYLSCKYCNRQPPVSASDRLVFPFRSVPCLSILISFSHCNRTEPKPHQQASNREEVFRRNQEGIIQEESICKVQAQQQLLVYKHAKFFMAVEDLPVAPALLSLATKPVHLTNSEKADECHTSNNRGNVAQQNVTN